MKNARCNYTSRWLALCCAGLLGVAGAHTPALAAPADLSPPTTAVLPTSTGGPPVLFAAFKDYVMGNRSRMVQLAFIAFGIGVAILVTATRKH